MQAMASWIFLLEMMWFRKHYMCGLPHPNTAQSSLRFKLLTFLFTQGLSRLHKSLQIWHSCYLHLCNEWQRVNYIQAVSWPSSCSNMILFGRVIIKLFPASHNDIRKGALGLKSLAILYSKPMCFLNKGPISLPWLVIPFCDVLFSQQVVLLCVPHASRNLCFAWDFILVWRIADFCHNYMISFPEVFEKDTCSILRYHLACNNLLVSEQNGFR